MKISYSLLASNHLNLTDDLKEKASRFDSIHFDIIDENYAGGLGLSVITLEQLSENVDYEIDVHILMKSPEAITNRIINQRINNIFFQIDYVSLENFKNLRTDEAKKGVAVKLDYHLPSLNLFLPFTKSVLLLCIDPSIKNKKQKSEPIKRVKEFRKFFPDFTGELIVDGGVSKSDIDTLKKLRVDTVIVGASHFNN